MFWPAAQEWAIRIWQNQQQNQAGGFMDQEGISWVPSAIRISAGVALIVTAVLSNADEIASLTYTLINFLFSCPIQTNPL